MIQNQKDIYAKLIADTALKNALGATPTNTKIFPTIPENFESFPCIAYSVVGGSMRSYPRGTEDVTLEFHIYANNIDSQGKTQCENIFSALNNVMNYLQDYNKTIVYCKLSTELDLPETDRKLWGKVVRYQVWTKN